jgi:hypothetical protein
MVASMIPIIMRSVRLKAVCILMASCVVMLSGCCETSVGTRTDSPSGKHWALVYNTNCGATTPYYTIVEVGEEGVRFTGKMEDAVLVVMEPAEIDVEWLSEEELLLMVPEKAPVQDNKSKYGSVSIIIERDGRS